MNREYHAWNSPALGRPMELLWFGHRGTAVLMFPTSMGRFYQNEDFGLVGSLAPKIDAGELQVCCVDSVDEESWYAREKHPSERIRRHDQYDAYIRDEVLPYIRHRSGSDRAATFGASFGAYHAMNLACRYPERVHAAICFSGLYDIHRYLDGYWDELCYYHCPTAFVPNLNGDWTGRLSNVRFVIATGELDTLYGCNVEFAEILRSRGLPCHAEFWPHVFGHDWPYWKDNLIRFV